MKNVTLNLKKAAKSGFSLVEMLVVIAVIGVIAAIAIPNIGSINDSARAATAQRNAQSVASVLNAAAAAGANLGTEGVTNATTAISVAEAGIVISTGTFTGKKFTTGTFDTEITSTMENHLDFDSDNNQVLYTAKP